MRDRAVFERLAQHFEHVAGKFWKLVEKKQSVVRKRNFPGARDDTAADQPSIRNRVMW